MPSLAELQRAFLAALFDPGAVAALAPEIEAGTFTAAERLSVHRDTTIGGLSHALGQSFPAIRAILGPDGFESAVVSFAAISPPHHPVLALYGAGFAAHLSGRDEATAHPWLYDLARLEWTIDQVRRGMAVSTPIVLILGETRVTFDPPPVLFTANYDVAALRDAALMGDPMPIGRSPGIDSLAVWQERGGEVGLQSLNAGSAAVLGALLDGADFPQALEIAYAAGHDTESLAAAVSSDILSAGFAVLQPVR